MNESELTPAQMLKILREDWERFSRDNPTSPETLAMYIFGGLKQAERVRINNRVDASRFFERTKDRPLSEREESRIRNIYKRYERIITEPIQVVASYSSSSTWYSRRRRGCYDIDMNNVDNSEDYLSILEKTRKYSKIEL